MVVRMSVRVGLGTSSDRDVVRAARGAAGDAQAALAGRAADLALVFVAGIAPDDAPAVLEAVHDELGPRAVAGSAALAVLGDGRQIPGDPAIAVWAAHLDGGAAQVEHVTRDAALPDLRDASAVVVLPDAYSFPIRRRLPEIGRVASGTPVVGGCASARLDDGRTVLFADGVQSGGMSLVALRDVEVIPIVAQGQVPVGRELVVSDGPT